jgi:hypothetical protein
VPREGEVYPAMMAAHALTLSPSANGP